MDNTNRKVSLPSNLRIVILLLLLPFLLNGQIDPLYFHQISPAQNLTSGNWNYYVLKDTKGFVWISSIDGLNRYDGKNVKNYYSNDHDSTTIADNAIQSQFFEDRNGDIWFATNKAINCFDRKKGHFSHIFLKDKKVMILQMITGFYILTTLKMNCG